MPEAPMHEDELPSPSEDYVRFAGQVWAMQLISNSHRVQNGPYGNLGPCIFAFDCRHALASLLVLMLEARYTLAQRVSAG